MKKLRNIMIKETKIIKTAFLATAILTLMLLIAGCSGDSEKRSDYDNSNGAENVMPQIIIDDEEKGSIEDEGSNASGKNKNDDINESSERENDEPLWNELSANDTFPDSDDALMLPMLQNPTDDSVIVQWFTVGEGNSNYVLLYENEAGTTQTIEDEQTELETNQNKPEYSRKIEATTIKLSRIRGGLTIDDCNDATKKTEIYKHTAVVDELPAYYGHDSERVPYRIESDGVQSDLYSLASRPQPGTPVKVLLTSDMQAKDMCAANIQKMYETVGRVDAILCNGDCADIPDRAYDWFYADNAFFRVLTGCANDSKTGETYRGAPLLQNIPIYTSIGNHEVMGVYDEETDLSMQFNYPCSIEHAKNLYQSKYGAIDSDNKDSDNKDSDDSDSDSENSNKKKEFYENFIRDNSFNTITYEEIFELPVSDLGGEKYYATSFGDIRLISLFVSRIWRAPSFQMPAGKYSELPGIKKTDNLYGDGEFIFEPCDEDSDQIKFLRSELESTEYSSAKYKLAMFHSEAHSLGVNQSPAFTDPVSTDATDPVTGLPMRLYDYPIDKDYIINVIEPLLTKYGTQLLFEAHSHVWNRFVTESGMNVLEASNVGNTYGGFDESDEGVKKRDNLPSCFTVGDPYEKLSKYFDKDNYSETGDPNGLDPVYPTEVTLPDGKPYLSSNTITAFSVLDTKKGTVDSYMYDLEKPDSEVVLFDSFLIE